MGLGIGANADIPASGLLRRRPSRDDVFRRIQGSIDTFIDDDLHRRFVSTHTQAHELTVNLHPASEPLFITWDPGHKIRADAKTSTAGPGYHDCVCRLLEHLESTCGLEWEISDETGYFETRSFGSLQNEMWRFLRFIGAQLEAADLRECSTIALNWPISTPQPVTDCKVISPSGYWTSDWWKRFAEAAEHERATFGEQFYPWWNQGTDATFWRGLGLHLLWNDVPWHPPIAGDERRTVETVFACFDHARKLDASLSLPESELEELRNLANASDEEIRAPRSTGIGFHRSLMRFDTTGDWSVSLPGYYFRDFENDGGTAVFWFGDRTVRVSSFNFEMKTPRTLEHLVGDEGDIEHAPNVHLKGRASIEWTQRDNESYWLLSGKLACNNSICIVSICYEKAEDKQWAIDVFRSISHPTESAQT
jgi:hypothetical protein